MGDALLVMHASQFLRNGRVAHPPGNLFLHQFHASGAPTADTRVDNDIWSVIPTLNANEDLTCPASVVPMCAYCGAAAGIWPAT